MTRNPGARFWEKIKCIATVLAGLAVLGAVAIALFTYSGIYNIAASTPHLPFVRWWLELGMQRSVKFHASGIKVPPLGDAAMVERGLRHFESGCASCHGAPGFFHPPIGERMLPHAPDLSEKVTDWSAGELFWIVKHGIKMTGMPAWAAQQRDDEVWSLVAFLRVLPGLTPQAYRTMTDVPVAASMVGTNSGRLIAAMGPPGKAEAACARCHGLDGAGHASGAFPRLSGQDQAYLLLTMQAYATGERPSGIMQPIARALSEREINEVAAYYASVENAPQRPEATPTDLTLLQQGGALAAIGAPERRIEACVNCHGPRGQGGQPANPALAGQYRGYLEQQLLLWKMGSRGDDPKGIMAPIARRMSMREIQATAAYFASLPSDRAHRSGDILPAGNSAPPN